MDITQLSTEELVAELSRRKSTELPLLVQEVNERLKQIKVLAGEIHNEVEPFTLNELKIVESGLECGSVIYTEHEIEL